MSHTISTSVVQVFDAPRAQWITMWNAFPLAMAQPLAVVRYFRKTSRVTIMLRLTPVMLDQVVALRAAHRTGNGPAKDIFLNSKLLPVVT